MSDAHNATDLLKKTEPPAGEVKELITLLCTLYENSEELLVYKMMKRCGSHTDSLNVSNW